jgi:hypothetical protein
VNDVYVVPQRPQLLCLMHHERAISGLFRVWIHRRDEEH